MLSSPVAVQLARLSRSPYVIAHSYSLFLRAGVLLDSSRALPGEVARSAPLSLPALGSHQVLNFIQAELVEQQVALVTECADHAPTRCSTGGRCKLALDAVSLALKRDLINLYQASPRIARDDLR